MNKVDLPVGTQFYVDGDLLIVKECETSEFDPQPCHGCYFFENDTSIICGEDFSLSCVCSDRKDRSSVIFSKVEEKP